MHPLRKALLDPVGVLTGQRWHFGLRHFWIVAVATVAAMGSRIVLTPWLGADIPFVTTFAAVAIVAFFAGITAGAVTAVACAFWVVAAWWPPYTSPDLGWQQVSVFIPAAFLVAFFSGQGRDEPENATGENSANVTVRSLRFSMFAAAALPTLMFIAAAAVGYAQAFDEARLRVDREVRIAEEHAARVVQANEAITHAVLDLLSSYSPEELVVRERELHLKLAELATRLTQVQSIVVYGPDAKALVSSLFFPVPQISVPDREYFRQHQAGYRDIYISEPLESRFTGDFFFNVSRRWEREGQFAGVVSASLYPSYFSDFYKGLAQDEPGLMVMLARSDGSVIARWPPLADPGLPLGARSALGAAMRAGKVEGRVEGVSDVDGKERLSAYRRLDRHPLYILAGIDRQQVLAGWERRFALLAAFTFPISMALVYVAWVALRRTRRELDAQQRLQHEVEQRARVETALRHMQKLEALGRLTGGVAHDFNNLLAIVNNNLHLIQRLNPALDSNKQIAAIGRAVSAGERLTRQLLTFARRQPLQPEVIQLQERLPALLALIAPTLGSNIESKVEVDATTKPVLVDPAELELAVINLAVNAKDAMQDGGRLTLSARNCAPGEIDIGTEFVVLTVADSGQGIDPELSERVFEPFFTTKPSGQGTGLGLSQVYGLCAQAGGTARIDSTPQQGTQVHMYLPTADPMPHVSDERRPPDDRKLDCSILLVEDNEQVAMATQPLLQTVGCTVTWAASGDAARNIVDADPSKFDIVISDMAMPGELDGLALGEYLRKRYPEIQVVLVTGFTNQLQEASARRFTVLAKPCSPAALEGAIREGMRRRAALKTEPVSE